MTRIVLPGDPLVDRDTALRPWRDSDIAALVDACRDREIVRWTRVPDHYTEADARAYLLQRYDAIHAGTTAPFAIFHANEQTLAGSIALMRIDWEQRRGEVGYWLARPARGHGHATRAVRLVCGWAFRALGLERVELHAAVGNLPSQRVAERAGFTREGVLRAYMRGKEGQQDMVAFGLLADGIR
jgi:RimJ/RimL family protein N-acetyltransferase